MEDLQARNAALAQQLMAINATTGAPAGDPQAAIQAEMRASRLEVEKQSLQKEVRYETKHMTPHVHLCTQHPALLITSSSADHR